MSPVRRSPRWIIPLVAAAAISIPTATPAGVLQQNRQSLVDQLYACFHLENILFVGVQDPNPDLLKLRATLAASIACLRALVAALDGLSALTLGISDEHYLEAVEELGKALRLEESDLARLDAKLAAGKPVTRPLRGLLKAQSRKQNAGNAILDLRRRTAGSPLVPSDFVIDPDVIDVTPAPPAVPLPETNAIRWRPETVGKKPNETAGWLVTVRDGKIAIKTAQLPDRTKVKTFTFRGTSRTTTGTASFTTDDVLTQPFLVQATGGLYVTKEKARAAALGARSCLTLDREPQTDPPQFYGVCTNHLLAPFGTQVFDFTDQGLAGGNLFFPDASLISLQVSLANDALHTEVQPRGDASGRQILQNGLTFPNPWPAARAGFGATQLAEGAVLGIEQVVAWNAPRPFLVTLEQTDLLAEPDAGATVLDALDPFGTFEPLHVAGDDSFFEVVGAGVVGWVPRNRVLPVNTQGLPIGD
jgi:hypothetical protein